MIVNRLPKILSKSILLGLACTTLSVNATQYVIKINESIPENVQGEWNAMPSAVTDWVKGEELSNCSQWLPNAENYLVGVSLNQTRNCNVVYSRTITEREMHSVTGEVRQIGVSEDTKIVSESFSQKTIGLNNVITGRNLSRGQEISTHGVPCSEIPADKRDWIIKADFILNKESSVVTCGQVRLKFQDDGNLVLYTPSGARWWTASNSPNAGRFVFQSDGNMVVYTAKAPYSALWHSHTYSNHNSTLKVSNSGGISIKNADGSIIWSK